MTNREIYKNNTNSNHPIIVFMFPGVHNTLHLLHLRQFYACLYICGLPVYLFCLPICLPVYLPVCLLACLPICLFAYMPVCLYDCLPICLSAYMPVCLYASLPVCLPAYMPVCLYACLSNLCACLSVCFVNGLLVYL